MYFYNNYVSVAEQRKKSAREVRRLRAMGFKPRPVEPFTGAIAESSLGKAWCYYAEFLSLDENRMARGKRYLRAGNVCHLDVQPGKMSAMILGSTLYFVNVEVELLSAERWQAFLRTARKDVGIAMSLAQGRLGEEALRLAVLPKTGIFPKSSEIDFLCSCPDGSVPCKHGMAAMFAFARILDKEPELLFRLRGVDPTDLFETSLDHLLLPATNVPLVMEKEKLEGIFDIELDMGPEPPAQAAILEAATAQIEPKPEPEVKVAENASPPAAPEKATPPAATEKPPFDPRYPTAKNLLALRMYCGMSLQQFADELSVDLSEVIKWEKPGLVRFSAAILKKMSRLQDRATEERHSPVRTKF